VRVGEVWRVEEEDLADLRLERIGSARRVASADVLRHRQKAADAVGL
jgi:hypothetical protein